MGEAGCGGLEAAQVAALPADSPFRMMDGDDLYRPMHIGVRSSQRLLYSSLFSVQLSI